MGLIGQKSRDPRIRAGQPDCADSHPCAPLAAQAQVAGLPCGIGEVLPRDLFNFVSTLLGGNVNDERRLEQRRDRLLLDHPKEQHLASNLLRDGEALIDGGAREAIIVDNDQDAPVQGFPRRVCIVGWRTSIDGRVNRSGLHRRIGIAPVRPQDHHERAASAGRPAMLG